jgi:nucleotide-binding universal stress UspA family protein
VRNILLATDGSVGAERAVEVAATLAKAAGGQLFILTVGGHLSAGCRVAPDGRVHLERVCCAVDAGRLVHPDGARNQIEGGVQQAASWTPLEELKVRDGVVSSTSWREYPIATFHDAPRAIAGWDRSPCQATAVPPFDAIAAATSSTGSKGSPASTSGAPSWANLWLMASPMPVPAPVTIATLPCRRIG